MELLIELSATKFIRPERILGCKIYQEDDNCWYVDWDTIEGIIKSDAHTGKIAARNYIDRIDKEMTMSEVLDNGGIGDD